MPHTRRTFFQASAASLAAGLTPAAAAAVKTIQTPVLTIAYEDNGQGLPIVLLHGFPDDVRAFDEVAPPLLKAGYRGAIVRFVGEMPSRRPQLPQEAAEAAPVSREAGAPGLWRARRLPSVPHLVPGTRSGCGPGRESHRAT